MTTTGIQIGIPFFSSGIIEKIDVETLEKKKVKELGEIEVAKVRIKTEKPIVVEKFPELKELGRFALMEEGEIVAGGTIV